MARKEFAGPFRLVSTAQALTRKLNRQAGRKKYARKGRMIYFR